MTGVWVEADAWLRQYEHTEEAKEAERYRLRDLRPPAPLIGYTVPAHPPEAEEAPPTTAYTQKLLLWIDEEADRQKKAREHQTGGGYSGRRLALIENRELAVAVRQLCLEWSVGDVLAWLGVSRNSLSEVWAAHGFDPPRRRIRPRGSRAGGMRS